MRYNTIKLNDISNSDCGVNLSLWTQGCPHRCKGCFNPETWDFNDGKEFKKEDLDYIIENIDKNNIKRNLSILGGEPLCPENIEGVIDVCKRFKDIYPNKKIYLWTGYVLDELNDVQKQVLNYIDVLVDGKFEEPLRDVSLELRGSSNQNIIMLKLIP